MRYVYSGSIRLAVFEWGDPSKTPILLVHGYPDTHAVWTGVAEHLAAQFHVIAYDVRGAGASSIPEAEADYALTHLVADMRAVLDAVSPSRPVHLVGHDWGSIQGWEAAADPSMSGRIASFTSISGPSLDHVGKWMRRRLSNPTPANIAEVLQQAARSWYIGMFRLPVIAPAWWTLFGNQWGRMLEKIERVRGIPWHPAPTHKRDGRYGINLYRANVHRRVSNPSERFVRVPVHLLVPEKDRFVSTALFDGLDHWAPNLVRTSVIGGHWTVVKHPDAVAERIASFCLRVG